MTERLFDSASFYEDLFDALPDIVVFRIPVFSSTNEVVDFKIAYINHPGGVYSQKDKSELIGTTTIGDGIPTEQVAQVVFEQCLEVYRSGITEEYSYYSSSFNTYVDAIRKPFRNGVLTIIQDKSTLRKVEQQGQEQLRLKTAIVENAPTGIVSYVAVRNEQGTIVDFNSKFFNTEVNRLTGFTDEQRKNVPLKILLQNTDLEPNFERYKTTVETGEPFTHELYVSTTNKWLSFKGVKLDDGFVSIVSDITESKVFTIEIEKQKNLLNNILQFSHNGISVSEVIRSSDGEVIDSRTILANESAVQFTGLTKEEYLTKTTKQIDPQIFSSPVYNLALETLKTGTPFHTQYFIEPTGRWLELSVSKMDDDHLINVFTDITETKKAHLEMERTSEYLQHILNTAQTGIFLFAPVYDVDQKLVDFRFVTANRALAAYVGQTPEALTGELGSKWFPDYKSNGLFEYYSETYLTGKSNRFDLHYFGSNIDVWLDIQSTKMSDGVLVTFSDYTSLKHLQQQLEKSIEELQRSNANLEEFAYAASHDLKEPIRKIHFFADRIKTKYADLLDEAGIKTFERLQLATKRMQMLVDDLLTYSHVNLKPTQLERVDLNDKIRLVLNDLELAVEEKNAKIYVGKMPVILGHRRQIQQLFQNIISNALKYSKKEEVPVISITCKRLTGRMAGIMIAEGDLNKEFYLIDFKDNGIGFRQEDADLIFQVFQRLHGDSEVRGTGVGLSIARKVAENHGGYIWAESAEGKGSVFHVLFPANE